MIEYTQPKNSEPSPDSGGGKYIKLREHLEKEGDSLRLLCQGGRSIPASEAKFGVARFEWDVLMKVDGEKVPKILACDAPDEANEFRGSQIYRGMFENNIQENDVFEVEHGGLMDNKYKTTIYRVMKVVA